MEPRQIINHGDLIRLEGWTECALQVMDIGSFLVVGALIEVKTNKIIVPVFFSSLDQDWQKVITIQELIKTL